MAFAAAPIGQIISLKASATNLYVSADQDLDATAPLVADRTTVNTWEQFQVVDAGGGLVALLSIGNGKYVSADQNLGANTPLVASRTVFNTWEEFHWIDLGNGQIHLLNVGNGKYVSADLNIASTAPLNADRTTAQAWETFAWATVGGGGSSGGGSAGLPKHLLLGYWQNFTNGSTCPRLSAVPTSYTIAAVAFANSTSTPGAVDYTTDSGLAACIGGGYNDSQFTSDISTLHSRGQKVILSIGGANGTVAINNAASATSFANSAHALMTKFGFDGVDIDLESGINVTNLASALQQLAALSPGLIITMAPQTTDVTNTSSPYFALALKIQNILTIVNTQYYNSGTMFGCDGNIYAEGTEDFATAQACILIQGGLRPDQIGLGFPATSAAAGGGYVDPSVVVNALDCLTEGQKCGAFRPSTTWPTLRGAMTWSISWDATTNYNFANTVKAGLNALP
ncbi:glycosyl hydrolase family 18 protein [Terriglobus saanensis]|uniref:glycosyl hydrolase family 18 protein n=1 Tax=Terriglobus saanensis TaxID=870903 RepID=UPI0002F35BA0|nr:glycosyl hydrolase family 18 protein [Terriglobus saanensis]